MSLLPRTSSTGSFQRGERGGRIDREERQQERLHGRAEQRVLHLRHIVDASRRALRRSRNFSACWRSCSWSGGSLMREQLLAQDVVELAARPGEQRDAAELHARRDQRGDQRAFAVADDIDRGHIVTRAEVARRDLGVGDEMSRR